MTKTLWRSYKIELIQGTRDYTCPASGMILDHKTLRIFYPSKNGVKSKIPILIDTKGYHKLLGIAESKGITLTEETEKTFMSDEETHRA
jgi:hypothetical protein